MGGEVGPLALALSLALAPDAPSHAQSDLAALRPMGRMIAVDGRQVQAIIRGADHNSLLNNKDHGGEVANAVVKMVEARRHH